MGKILGDMMGQGKKRHWMGEVVGGEERAMQLAQEAYTEIAGLGGSIQVGRLHDPDGERTYLLIEFPASPTLVPYIIASLHQEGIAFKEVYQAIFPAQEDHGIPSDPDENEND